MKRPRAIDIQPSAINVAHTETRVALRSTQYNLSYACCAKPLRILSKRQRKRLITNYRLGVWGEATRLRRKFRPSLLKCFLNGTLLEDATPLQREGIHTSAVYSKVTVMHRQTNWYFFFAHTCKLQRTDFIRLVADIGSAACFLTISLTFQLQS